MTKEQEAIENLTDLLKQRNEQQVQITTYNLFENIETVLSMLKHNSAEIEQKNTELAEKNAEIERLNRQIDLMAEEIEKGDIEFTEYCNFKIVCDRNCKECIERYFKRKATNNA